MKATFILTQLLTTKPQLIDEVLRLNIIAPIVAMVDDPSADVREKAVTLLEMLLNNESVRARCKDIGLAGVIEDRLKALEAEEGVEADERAQSINTLKRLQGK